MSLHLIATIDRTIATDEYHGVACVNWKNGLISSGAWWWGARSHLFNKKIIFSNVVNFHSYWRSPSTNMSIELNKMQLVHCHMAFGELFTFSNTHTRTHSHFLFDNVLVSHLPPLINCNYDTWACVQYHIWIMICSFIS